MIHNKKKRNDYAQKFDSPSKLGVIKMKNLDVY